MTRPAPVLVVGTGRCGSTLVSTMMRAHPEVLSVSELFSFITDLGGRIPQAFPAEAIDGPGFWRILAEVHPRQNLLLRHGLRMAEVAYPFEGGRYDAREGVPGLLLTALPHLCPEGDADALFDELGAAMRARGPAPVGDHYRALFAWLMARFDRRTWVERSGGSLRIVGRLLASFPEARFVHLVRDGRNTALSMSRHIGFRMALICFQLIEMLGVDPFESEDRSEADDLPDDLHALLPENFSAGAFADFDLSPAICGHYWSGEIIRGLETLRALPDDRVLHLRYEDLLAEPRAAVTRLAEALDLGQPDRAWLEHAIGLVGAPRSAWRELPEKAARDELDAACRPGFEALAKLGLHWPAA